MCRHADTNEREVLLRKLGLHFHLTRFRQPEQCGRTGTYDLSDFYVARKDQTRGRSNDIELIYLRARCSELSFGHPDLRKGSIASRFFGIDVCL